MEAGGTKHALDRSLFVRYGSLGRICNGDEAPLVRYPKAVARCPGRDARPLLVLKQVHRRHADPIGLQHAGDFKQVVLDLRAEHMREHRGQQDEIEVPAVLGEAQVFGGL